MKKFVKVCAILALAFLVIGAGMFYLGSKNVDSNSVKDVVSELTNGMVNFELDYEDWDLSWVEDSAVYDINAMDSFHPDYTVLTGDVERYLVTEENVTRLALELGGCSFIMKDSGNSNIYLEGENVGKLQAYVKGNTLHLKALQEYASNMNSSEIVLYLPVGKEYDKVEINLGAGNVEFANLSGKEATFSVGAGEILGDGLVCGKVEANVGAGAIHLDDAKVDTASLNVSMGHCVFEGSVNKALEATCAMGNITLCMDGEMKDYNYDYSCMLGGISIDGHEITTGDKKIKNGASKDLTLACTMGNINVEF